MSQISMTLNEYVEDALYKAVEKYVREVMNEEFKEVVRKEIEKHLDDILKNYFEEFLKYGDEIVYENFSEMLVEMLRERLKNLKLVDKGSEDAV